MTGDCTIHVYTCAGHAASSQSRTMSQPQVIVLCDEIHLHDILLSGVETDYRWPTEILHHAIVWAQMLACTKVGQMCAFNCEIVAAFFSDFGDLMKRLYNIVFETGDPYQCTATHNAMLNVLVPVFRQLPDKDKVDPSTPIMTQLGQSHKMHHKRLKCWEYVPTHLANQ